MKQGWIFNDSRADCTINHHWNVKTCKLNFLGLERNPNIHVLITTLRLDVRGRLVSSALISGIRARKLLSKGAQGYLAFLINTPRDKVKLEDMLVVNEFFNVFPDELKSMPPRRK